MAFGFLLFPSSTGSSVVAGNLKAELSTSVGLIKGRRTKFEKTNIEVYAGDQEAYVIQVYMDGAKFDLTGYTVEVKAKRSARQTKTYFDITIDDGDNDSNFAEGKIVLVIPDTITATLPTVCLYDIQATDGSNNFTILSGEIHTSGQITG